MRVDILPSIAKISEDMAVSDCWRSYNMDIVILIDEKKKERDRTMLVDS